MESKNGDRAGLSLINRLVDIQLSSAQIREVLDERASVLAQTPEKTADIAALVQHVAFQLSGETYGLDVRLVEEIQPIKDLALIPCTPAFVVGAVNVRGSILPVIDIKSFFALAESEVTPTSKIIVINADETRLGILADSVDEVMDLCADDVKPQIATLSGAPEQFIKGVTENAVIVLDMAALANDKQMIIHEDV